MNWGGGWHFFDTPLKISASGVTVSRNFAPCFNYIQMQNAILYFANICLKILPENDLNPNFTCYAQLFDWGQKPNYFPSNVSVSLLR